MERLGIRHVKGVLLYGPPGTGKTLIARQIGKMLNGKEPKVVNGPEVLNKFVGEPAAAPPGAQGFTGFFYSVFRVLQGFFYVNWLSVRG